MEKSVSDTTVGVQLQTVRKEIRMGELALPFEVDISGGEKAFFCLGVRKSGSTLLHKMVNWMAAQNAVNSINIADAFFANGFVVKDWNNIDFGEILAEGNLYTGFRAFPLSISQTEMFRDGLKIFMFRDPRDALVSQFFSDAYSHKLPDAQDAGGGREAFIKKREAALNADIDEWVLEKCASLRQTMFRYTPLLEDPLCLSVRYEEFVFQKRRLTHKILKHFGWSLDFDEIETLMEHVDYVPETEDKKRFVRKAVPGDHVEKLRKSTIKKLNFRLADILKTYDYF